MEASGQSDNVQVATTTTTSESETLQFPSARRVADDPKTKIFTFEGLTPVSTADDTREDAMDADPSHVNDKEIVRDDNFASSPLTSDISVDNKDQNDGTNDGTNDDENEDVENGQIISACSSVKEKVAIWEKRIISLRSAEMYDVPFDEDPMGKNAGNADKVTTPVVLIGDEFEMPKETITEIPLDDVFESEIKGDTVNVDIDEKPVVVEINSDCNIVESEPVNTAKTTSKSIVVSMTNLLDEDEEPEIHSAPSDEKETSDSVDVETRDMPEQKGNEPGLISTTSLVETFGCPDAICTQVSKLWQS